MDIQKINWKIYIAEPSSAKPADFFRAFNSWIADSPEIFIDVADYGHAHDGPLTALIGYHADFWLDASDGMPGLLYNRRTPMDGTNAEKLASTLGSILRGAARIESDPVFQGNVKFRTDELLFIVNDRGIAPNTSETFSAIHADLAAAARAVLGASSVLARVDGAKRRFTVKISSEDAPSISTLVQRPPVAG